MSKGPGDLAAQKLAKKKTSSGTTVQTGSSHTAAAACAGRFLLLLLLASLHPLPQLLLRSPRSPPFRSPLVASASPPADPAHPRGRSASRWSCFPGIRPPGAGLKWEASGFVPSRSVPGRPRSPPSYPLGARISGRQDRASPWKCPDGLFLEVPSQVSFMWGPA